MIIEHWFLIKMANSLELSLDEVHKLSFIFLKKKLSRAFISNILKRNKSNNKSSGIPSTSYRRKVKQIKNALLYEQVNQSLFGHVYTSCIKANKNKYCFLAVERFTGWLVFKTYKNGGADDQKFSTQSKNRFLEHLDEHLPMKISYLESDYNAENMEQFISSKFGIPIGNITINEGDRIDIEYDKSSVVSFKKSVEKYNNYICTLRTFNRTPAELASRCINAWGTENVANEKLTKLLKTSTDYAGNIEKYFTELNKKELDFVKFAYKKKLEEPPEIYNQRATREFIEVLSLLLSSLILKCYPVTKRSYVHILTNKKFYIGEGKLNVFPLTESKRYELYDLAHKSFSIPKREDISLGSQLGHIIITIFGTADNGSMLFIAIDRCSSFSWNKRIKRSDKDKIKSIYDFLIWLQSKVQFKVLSLLLRLDFIGNMEEDKQLSFPFTDKQGTILNFLFSGNEYTELERYCKEYNIKLLNPGKNQRCDSNYLSEYLPELRKKSLKNKALEFDSSIKRWLIELNKTNFVHLEHLRALDKKTTRPRRYNKDLTPIGAYKLLLRCERYIHKEH